MKFNKFKNSLFFKIICFILIFSMFPWNITSPTDVKAANTGGHPSYFIETLLNSSGGYEVQVVSDSNRFGAGIEEKELKDDHDMTSSNKYVDWSVYSYNKNGTNALKASEQLSGVSSKGDLNTSTGLIFSFPSYDRGVTESYTKDYNRAIKVSDTLSSSLNNLMTTAKNELAYKSKVGDKNNHIDNSIVISRKLNPNSATTTEGNFRVVTLNNIKIYYACPSSYNFQGEALPGDDTKPMEIDKDGNLMAYVVQKDEELSASSNGFVWAMPKGYINPNGGAAIKSDDILNNIWGVANKNQADGIDAAWITIFSLAEYANAQAEVHNYTLTSAAYEEESFIESTIYNFVLGIYSGLLNILKLNTIPELIYNQGTRGGSGYEAGMMNSSWWNTVLKYHLIFQIIAWMMLIAAVAKILLQVNFSTVNPQMTISIMDTLQKIFTVGFALALCIPLIRAMATLNNLIVDIFQTQARSDGENLAAFGFAGIILLFGYLGITFTMNCIYIMRAIMIAILTASAPVFITSMAFAGPKQKGLFDNWLKELTANIFMQSVHAFAFAFLFDVMDASSVMVQLVIYFSLLPIVDMCRQLIFGQAGGFAVAQGKQASQTVGAFVKETAGGTVKGAGNLATGAIAKRMGIDTKMTDAAGSDGSSTSGESKAGVAGSRLNSNVAAIGDKIKSDGALGTKLANKIQGDGKAANFAKDVLRGADQVGGSALKGASKLADFGKSTGGIMGNAVTQANLGNVGDSVKASQTYGEGIATAEERAGHDITDAVENKVQAHNQKALNKAIGAQSTAQTKVNDAKEHAFNTYKESKSLGNNPQNDSYVSLANSQLSSAKSELTNATKKVDKYQNKLAKQNQRRGLSSNVNSSGNIEVSMNSNQVDISSGYGEAELDETQAYQIFGANYEQYRNSSTGKFMLGNQFVSSNKGSNIKFTVPQYGTNSFNNMKSYYDYDSYNKKPQDSAQNNSNFSAPKQKEPSNPNENNSWSNPIPSLNSNSN